MQQAHTGQSVALFGGLCGGVDFGENVARGYITVDQVEACSTLFPNSPGYFGPGGVAGNQNVLWGDYMYVDPANDFAQGETLVHIESAPAGFFVPGDYTYYGRYVAFTAVDQREPLPTTFATRFLNGGQFTGGTDLVCWRDSKNDPSPFVCGTLPNPFPLSQTQVVIFDEEENPTLVEESNFSPGIEGEDILVCRWEATRTEVGGPDFPVDPDFGWLYLNLNTSTGSVVDPFAQAWVTAIMSADGRFSVGFDAIALSSGCSSANIIIGEPL